MNLKCSGALLLGTLLALIPLEAFAGVQKHVDGDRTRVWIDGLTPGLSYEYNVNGADKVRSRTVNSCGWVQLSFAFGETPPGSVRIASDRALLSSATAISTTTLPESDRFCRNGVVVDGLGNPATATTAFTDPSGKFTFPGFTQNQTQFVEYVGVPDVRTRKANECGLIAFTHSPTGTDFTSFMFDGTNHTLAALPNAHEKICRKYKDGSVKLLVPTDP